MAQPKVFVSHSHVDDAFAEQLVADLRAAGANAWLDKQDMEPGDFTEHINAALEDCEWFVLVLTKSAILSPWVKQEVHAANRLKNQGRIRNLIFVKAQPVEQNEVPAIWGVYHTFDATADYRLACDRVLEAVGVHRVGEPQSPMTNSPTNSSVSPIKPDALDSLDDVASFVPMSLRGRVSSFRSGSGWSFDIQDDLRDTVSPHNTRHRTAKYVIKAVLFCWSKTLDLAKGLTTSEIGLAVMAAAIAVLVMYLLTRLVSVWPSLHGFLQ